LIRSDRVVLIGCGAIGGAVLRLLAERGNAGKIAAIGLRAGSARRHDLPDCVPVLTDPDALAGIRAGLVVEAAGRDSVAPWGNAALNAGMDFAVTSTSAFTDPALLDRMSQTAAAHGARLIIPPGALGGIDALAAASRMGLTQVEHRITKPPQAWLGTEAETLCDLTGLTASCTFFSGSAREAAARFPQNANAALIVALAGLGPDKSRVTLLADPAIGRNRHEIAATGDFGTMTLQFDNAPLPGNPKSSAMTALGLVRLIENLNAPIVI
jgi:aspartate dehydrogenase